MMICYQLFSILLRMYDSEVMVACLQFIQENFVTLCCYLYYYFLFTFSFSSQLSKRFLRPGTKSYTLQRACLTQCLAHGRPSINECLKNLCREKVSGLFQRLFCLPGEGFHNYHHTFPYDYSASEFGLNFNPTTWFIDVMCWLGLATDRKRATKPMVEARKAKTGDGSSWSWSFHQIRLLLTLWFMPSVTIVLLSTGWGRV